jgi:hypothetical protein
MIRDAANMFLSFSTEIGDRGVEFDHWFVDAGREIQILASVFIAK